MLRSIGLDQTSQAKTFLSVARNIYIFEATLYLIFIILLATTYPILNWFEYGEILSVLLIPLILFLFPIRDFDTLLTTFEQESANDDKIFSVFSLESKDWRYELILKNISPRIFFPLVRTFAGRLLGIFLILFFIFLLTQVRKTNELLSQQEDNYFKKDAIFNQGYFEEKNDKNEISQDKNHEASLSKKNDFNKNGDSTSENQLGGSSQSQNKGNNGDDGSGEGIGQSDSKGQSKGGSGEAGNKQSQSGLKNGSQKGLDGSKNGEDREQRGLNPDDRGSEQNEQGRKSSEQGAGKGESNQESKGQGAQAGDSKKNRHEGEGEREFQRGEKVDLQAQDVHQGDFAKVEEKKSGRTLFGKEDDFIPPKRYKRFFDN